MKKNSKGFFLAEAIVMIALVTTVIAFVYPNVSKVYNNYKNQALYYDQTEDLIALREIYKKSESKFKEKKNIIKEGKIDLKNFEIKNTAADDDPALNYDLVFSNYLSKIYIYKYMSNPSSSNYNFNKYLSRMKKTTNDKNAYRLVGVFKADGTTRYASIKINLN